MAHESFPDFIKGSTQVNGTPAPRMTQAGEPTSLYEAARDALPPAAPAPATPTAEVKVNKAHPATESAMPPTGVKSAGKQTAKERGGLTMWLKLSLAMNTVLLLVVLWLTWIVYQPRYVYRDIYIKGQRYTVKEDTQTGKIQLVAELL